MKYGLGILALSTLLLAGCSGGGPTTSALPAPAQPNRVVDVGVTDDALTTVDAVGIRLNGETATNTRAYGTVLGYFRGKTSTTSQIVSLPAGISVRFFNEDASFPHTLSFLGKATASHAPWPTSFNGSASPSPAGTAIGTTNFSTGALSPGQHSLLYDTGMPGFYMVGCAFHYNSFGMRTVIIVK